MPQFTFFVTQTYTKGETIVVDADTLAEAQEQAYEHIIDEIPEYLGTEIELEDTSY